jgi:hypothetical protein
MNDKHPITPPPELIDQWRNEWIYKAPGDNDELGFLALRGAQWGADQELIACGNYLKQCAAWEEEDVIEFYNYRRPKPPSLKEQALAALHGIHDQGPTPEQVVTIRRALEALND